MKGKKALKITLIVLAGILGGLFLTPFGIVVLMALVIALGAQQDNLPDHLVIINESTTPISWVEINDVRYDKNLKQGKKRTIEWDTWPCTVEIYGESELLDTVMINENPHRDMERDQWYLIVQDTPEGIDSSLSLWRELDEVEEWASDELGVDCAAGFVEEFISNHGPHGDGENYLQLAFFTQDDSPAEEMLAELDGWHRLPVSEDVYPVFYQNWPDCRNHDTKEARVPHVEEGWYFFRDDQVEGDAKWDESAYRARHSLNYTAAIYDSVNHILYVFELDT